jgi:hypothetical protein
MGAVPLPRNEIDRRDFVQPMPPPSKTEFFVFWTVGVVIVILSGAVAIYASHMHLWDLR